MHVLANYWPRYDEKVCISIISIYTREIRQHYRVFCIVYVFVTKVEIRFKPKSETLYESGLADFISPILESKCSIVDFYKKILVKIKF